MSDSLDRLYRAVLAARTADPASSRTARLLRAGRGKMAKKLAEEAVEVVIDAMNGHTDAVVRESADLLQSCSALGCLGRSSPGRMDRDGAARAASGHCREASEGGPRRFTAAQGRRARSQPGP